MATRDVPVAPPARSPRDLGTALVRGLSRYSFAFALCLMTLLLAISLAQNPEFGWTEQLAAFAPLALAAMASTPAIISGGGGFDLSISPLMTFASAAFVVWLAPHGMGGAAAVPIVLALGGAVGLVSGTIITRLRVPPIVATLSIYFILIGVDLKLLPVPKSIDASWTEHLAGTVGPIPGAIFTIGFPLLVWFLLGRTAYLRTLYAVGSNDATAYSSGVNVNVVRAAAYMLGGVFAAVGGLALVALESSADGSTSTSYALVAIAAIALGGTSLWGGRGGLAGAIFGAACIYLIGTLVSSLHIPSTWLQIVYGLVMLGAITFSGMLERRQARA